jgi:uncharacterized protein
VALRAGRHVDGRRLDLRQRLDLLRRGSGSVEPAPSTAPSPSFAERLDRLRPAGSKKPPRPSDGDVAALLGGERLAPGLVVLERLFPLCHRHGRYSFSEIGTACAPEAPLPDLTAGDVLLDTETTGLAGGTGTLVFLLGLARLEPTALRVRQLFLTGFDGEPHLLAAARDWLGQADRIVSFNGKCFDAPLIATRFRLAGAQDPLAGLEHADLLYPLRRAFGRHWPDCRLQTAEERLLRFTRSDDLPSWEIPAVWFDWVRRGTTHVLPALVEHNCLDLMSLAALIPALAAVYSGAGRMEADCCAIARGYVREGRPELAYAYLRSVGDALDVPARLLLARLHRGQGEWEAAVAVWEPLAEADNAEAVACLAKYHEHQRRDARAALELARRLVFLERSDPAHRHRMDRLEQKLDAGVPGERKTLLCKT